MRTLNELKTGSCARVAAITAKGSIRRRLQDIGLIDGTCVKCIQRSFTGDPAAYLICDAVIALRNEDAAKILIES